MTFDFKITIDALVTFVTGLSALLVYFLHKKDEKQKAAIIILSEIRSAESMINQIKTGMNISDVTSVMNEGHWKEYQHYFATSLDRDDIELLSNFYSSCFVIEQQINFVQSSLNVAMVEKMRITQEKLADFAEEAESGIDFKKMRDKTLQDLYWPNSDFFLPSVPQQKTLAFAHQIQFVSIAAAGQKLKKIAYASRWKIFI